MCHCLLSRAAFESGVRLDGSGLVQVSWYCALWQASCIRHARHLLAIAIATGENMLVTEGGDDGYYVMLHCTRVM